MKNHIPTIKAYSTLEVVLPNVLLLEMMEEIKDKIVNTMRLKLRNKNLTLNLIVG